MPPADPLASVCPRCSSSKIDQIAQITHAEDESDVLSDSIGPARADAPNMRCAICGHEWWRAPRLPEINPGAEGVPS